MDIIHGVHNEVETTHTSSQEVEEEEVKRNWVELPSDVLSLIFKKLGTIDILASVQWVCTSWWKLSKQPHLFRSVHVERVVTIFGRGVLFKTSYERSKRLAREAIDRSCGELVEFSVRDKADNGLLHYLSDKSGSLRCIRLASCGRVRADGLIEMAKKLPQLEDFEIINFIYMTKDVIETYGRLCPHLKSCRLNYVNYYRSKKRFHSVVVAIAQNMPELRSLSLFGCRISDDGLKAVLDGCPHLESLDLRRCFDLKFVGDLEVRCGNIKALRLPNDPTDDFEYGIELFLIHGFSDSDSDSDSYSDDVHYGFDYNDYDYNNQYYGSDDSICGYDYDWNYS